MSKKMEQAWEKNLQSRKCDRTGDRDSTSTLEEKKYKRIKNQLGEQYETEPTAPKQAKHSKKIKCCIAMAWQ